MEDGKVVEVEAKEYIGNLKAEARALKEALRRENDITPEGIGSEPGLIPNAANGVNGGGSGMDITTYIASRQGDVKSLTEGDKSRNSGNHEEIRLWREKKMFERTKNRRYDLINEKENEDQKRM